MIHVYFYLLREFPFWADLDKYQDPELDQDLYQDPDLDLGPDPDPDPMQNL